MQEAALSQPARAACGARTRRLAILHAETSMAGGASAARILAEARGMLDRGHAVALLAATGAPIVTAARQASVPTHELAVSRNGLANLVDLRAWMRRHGPGYDVVNTHGSGDSWRMALACATLPARPVLIRTRHVATPANSNPATRWLDTRATAHIVTAVESLRERLRRHNGHPPERMTCVRTGIDLERFRPRNQREARFALGLPHAPTLGVAAALGRANGHQVLLTAFASLRRRFPAWRLVLIGDGPLRRALQHRVEALTLGHCVTFAGEVANVAAWLPALDLFVLPSCEDEAVPQGLMEAMACGLAVVSTHVGGFSEAVVDGSTGILVPPGDVAALAGALGELMDDPLRRARMAEAALARARSEFALETMVDRMEQVYLRHAAGRA